MEVNNLEKYSKDETIRLRQKHIGPSCKVFFSDDPLKIVRARGQYMYDENGTEYLDCINNVAHVGHCHPSVVEAGARQMSNLSTNNRYLHDNIVHCAKMLADTFPGDLSVCYFVNSGSEANDLALRLARTFTGADDIICLDHAYHGHLSSVVPISPYKYNNPEEFDDVEYVHVAPCPDVYRGKYTNKEYPETDLGTKYANGIQAIISSIKNSGRRLSAFIAESLQSCGGQIVYPEKYIAQVFKHVREAGGVCIADEIQIGFGRVGEHMWGFQTYGSDIIPDIVTVGKPMGNGHPVAAVITTPKIAASFCKIGTYFNTFGGNPVSCAIASEVIDVIERENLVERARQVGGYMKKKLNSLKDKYQMIGDVRGNGLFLGVDLVKNRHTREPATKEADYLINRAKDMKIILSSEGPFHNVLKIKPPMVFNEENVDRVCEVIGQLLEELNEKKNCIN